jgi:hypothetical protein
MTRRNLLTLLSTLLVLPNCALRSRSSTPRTATSDGGHSPSLDAPHLAVIAGNVFARNQSKRHQVEGVEVNLYRLDESGLHHGLTKHTRTNRQGHFAFHSLPGGVYIITVKGYEDVGMVRVQQNARYYIAFIQ